MNLNAVENTCHKGCGWREAYIRQTEIVQAMMEESDRVFVKTRDMVRFLEEISEQPKVNNKPKKSVRSSYKWK